MLRLPRFQLHTPATVHDAALLLREHRATEQDAAKTGTPGITVMLVAGGTDLYPNMKRRQFTPQTLISLGKALPRAIHNGKGTVLLVRTEATVVLRFDNVAITNAPDVHVYLSRETGGKWSEVSPSMSPGTSPPKRSTRPSAAPFSALAFWRKKPVGTRSRWSSARSTRT